MGYSLDPRGEAEPQNVWMRSPNRNNAYTSYIVNASGNVNNNGCMNGNRAAPDCMGHRPEESGRAAAAGRKTLARSLAPGAESAEPHGGDGSTACRADPISAPDPLSPECLWEAHRRCRRGVMWKDSVASFDLNAPTKIARLSRELADGTYRAFEPRRFEISHPKPRSIVSVPYRDRVYQRALNDFAIYPAMSRRWVYDNCACQTGKGTDFARKRLKRFLREHYARYGTEGWVLSADVAGYYPNMPHEVAYEAFYRSCPADIADRAARVLDDQYEGDVGFDPGSQMVQIAGVAVLDPLDHIIKERLRVRRYVRYMDDMVLVCWNRRDLERALEEMGAWMAGHGMALHPKKTRIKPLSDGVGFLGFDFRLTTSGKVLMTVKGAAVKAQRRHLRGLVRAARRGSMSRGQVDQCYRSWRAHAAKGDSHRLLVRMDAYYKGLWREVTA